MSLILRGWDNGICAWRLCNQGPEMVLKHILDFLRSFEMICLYLSQGCFKVYHFFLTAERKKSKEGSLQLKAEECSRDFYTEQMSWDSKPLNTRIVLYGALFFFFILIASRCCCINVIYVTGIKRKFKYWLKNRTLGSPPNPALNEGHCNT